MLVKELAERTGVSGEVVRYYTRLGLLRPARDTANRYRRYSRADLLRLNFIRRAKTLGYTLGEIRRILRASDRRQSPCPQVREIILRRIARNKTHMEEAMALQKRMERAARLWQTMPDAVPIGDSVCHLIEQATGGRR
jgi:DNA-binding transcriptional MerR regulator